MVLDKRPSGQYYAQNLNQLIHDYQVYKIWLDLVKKAVFNAHLQCAVFEIPIQPTKAFSSHPHSVSTPIL